MKKRSRLLKVPCAVVVVNCSFVVQLLDRPPEDCQLKIFAKEKGAAVAKELKGGKEEKIEGGQQAAEAANK